MDRERTIESGQREQLEQLDGRAHQDDVAAVHPRPTQRAHQHAQAGVVDGAQAVEVEHHRLARMLGDDPHQAITQARHGGHIERTGDGDDDEAIDIVHVDGEIDDRATLQLTP